MHWRDTAMRHEIKTIRAQMKEKTGRLFRKI